MAFTIRTALPEDCQYAVEISSLYGKSSQERGTGIAVRAPHYIENKILRGNAIIATQGELLAGFCYIEVFSKEHYVSNSGLIVKHQYRGNGLAKKIKFTAFHHARNKYPNAKIFGITTSDIVMKINSDLGYLPVSYQQLTDDDEFWKECSSCPNYDILMRNQRKMCLCTSMLAASKNEMLVNLTDQILNNEKEK